ncbi:MAG: SDR family NAD(P)-dependent oxidoreductase [Bacteroidota bacterium]
MPLTLITGASFGIGAELAKVAAQHGDDLLLIARNSQKLDELAREINQRFSVKVHVLSKDLSRAVAPSEIYGWCIERGLQVDNLINNAGFGDLSAFSVADAEKLERMIAVNITSLTALTRLFIPGMIQRRSGRILNVASTAAFQPGPLMAVYYATKSYVLSFSEALRIEVEKSGVTVTTLCPGPTESEFKHAANMTQSRLMTKMKNPSSYQVADYGYRSMMRGKGVAIHGALNRFFAFTTRFSPQGFSARIAMFLNRTV